ncbi:MAG TPA: hypothetical protein VKX40_00920 [Aequorivita sp.]|nr:hypothetical protein [Aequorivita sp.]
MNVTLKNLTKLRIAGMLSEAARHEAEKKLLIKLDRKKSEEALSETLNESNDYP